MPRFSQPEKMREARERRIRKGRFFIGCVN